MALLAAAIDVFSDVGFAAGTTKMIAEKAKVTRGALQYHFSSKEDMIVAVVDHAMNQINFRFNGEEHVHKPIGERIEFILANYREAFSSPTFLAVIQIYLGVRKDPQLSHIISRQHALSRKAINKTWVDLFPEAANDPDKLSTLRRITMGIIRGYVVGEALGGSNFWLQDEIVVRAILKEQIDKLIAP
jgi:AcrR family transcriptional regulator